MINIATFIKINIATFIKAATPFMALGVVIAVICSMSTRKRKR